ncbi:MAG: AAA family ATPase [Candidatus Magnetomorum sp.]|nr:AAA family ATPase [Candidatus Magnetomorum sp.]
MTNLFSDQYINFNLIHENHKSRIFRTICRENSQSTIIKSLNLKHPSEKDIHLFSNGYHMIKQINNPYLINVHDLKLGYKQAAFVMEDIGGSSLDKVLVSRSLSIEEIFNIAILLIDNLKHIHDAGFVHMDINPSNVIWNSETGIVKIIDFEIAASQMENRNYYQTPEEINGSVAYISPEQTGRLNIPVDYRSDYYSLGASLYELLTHSKPFVSDDYQDIIYCHIAKAPQNPTELNPDIHQVLSDIVLKLMAKMPEDRYQSHAGLKYDLVKCQKEFHLYEKIRHFSIGAKDISEKFILSKKLYGRNKEIASIKKIIQTSQKTKRLILIHGEEGSGKTSLIKEISKFVIETRRIHIRGNCNKKFQSTPYSVWISAINKQIDQWLSLGKQAIDKIKSLLLLELETNGSVITNLIPRLELIIGHQKQHFISGYIEHHNLFNHVFCKLLKAISQEKEMIILFDDIQWMDPASVKLLMTILQHKHLKCTILLSSTNNQFYQKFLNLTASGNLPDMPLHQIPIKNISAQDIFVLLFNSFHFSTQDCKQFSNLLHLKTGGNVSFVHQMLVTFYSEKLIWFDKTSSQWRINFKKIRQYEIADNLVDLSLNRYQQLSIESRNILEKASCIGCKVDKKILAHLIKLSESALNKMLVDAVNKGIIISENLVLFFSHHRIQKSLYNLLPDEKRYLIHKSIALFMYNNFKENEDKNCLFEILFHYDKAFPVLQEEEILLLINLNKDAGVHAINKGAFDTAEKYLSKAISIASDISYDLHSHLKEIIYENRAKAYTMLKEFKKAEQDVDQLLSDVTCLTKKGRFCELALKIYTMSDQFEKGLHFGLNYLRKAGLDIPEKLTLHYEKQLIKETNEYLEKDIENLLSTLPWMTDETMQYAAIILCRLMPFFYYSKPDLIAIPPCLSILLYRKYGQFITTPASLTTYAATLCHPKIQHYSLGFHLAETAENLCHQTKNQQLLPYILKVRYGFISCWQKTHYHCMEKISQGFRAGLDIGDNEMAAYCR